MANSFIVLNGVNMLNVGSILYAWILLSCFGTWANRCEKQTSKVVLF